MKKKNLISITLLCGILFVNIFVLTACKTNSKTLKSFESQYKALDVSYSDKNVSVLKKFSFKGTAGDYIDLNFSSPTNVNTVTIKEDKVNVKEFEIQALVEDGETSYFETIYKQDRIKAWRYCSLDDITTKTLRVVVTKTDAPFKIDQILAYNIPKRDVSNFGVTTYLIADDRFLDDEQFNANIGIDSFIPVSDVIVFGDALIIDDGSIEVGERLYQAIEKLHGIEETLKKKFNIYINFLNGPYESPEGISWKKEQHIRAEYYKRAMINNQDKLLNNIANLVAETGVDGIGFDWEFPLRQKDWNKFGDFLIALDKKLPDTKISTALAVWGVNLPAKAKKVIDKVELMAYDNFDKVDNNHSDFYESALVAVDYIRSRGFKDEQIFLGVPYYAREIVGDPKWIAYADHADALKIYGNYSDADGGLYFNGYQMIKDKTAFAIDIGIAGMMIWSHTYDCHFDKTNSDGEYLALMRAMEEAKKQRNI